MIMAYAIVDCETVKTSVGVVILHWVYYTFDNDLGNTKKVRVQIDNNEMVDPTDTAELQTLADVKATTAKTAWLANLATPDVKTSSTVLNGPVTI